MGNKSDPSFNLQPFYIFTLITLGVGIYISLDIALGITEVIGGVSNPPQEIRSIALFVLTSIWPAVYVLSAFLSSHHLIFISLAALLHTCLS